MSYKAVLSRAKLVSHSYYVPISTSKHTIPSFCHSRQVQQVKLVMSAKQINCRANVYAYVSLCMLLSACEWIASRSASHLVTYGAEQDVHICMKLKGRGQHQWETWFFTGLLLLEPACKMQIWQKTYYPLRHGICIRMHFVFFLKMFMWWIYF